MGRDDDIQRRAKRPRWIITTGDYLS
jgi:hypothetical protein